MANNRTLNDESQVDPLDKQNGVPQQSNIVYGGINPMQFNQNYRQAIQQINPNLLNGQQPYNPQQYLQLQQSHLIQQQQQQQQQQQFQQTGSAQDNSNLQQQFVNQQQRIPFQPSQIPQNLLQQAQQHQVPHQVSSQLQHQNLAGQQHSGHHPHPSQSQHPTQQHPSQNQLSQQILNQSHLQTYQQQQQHQTSNAQNQPTQSQQNSQPQQPQQHPQQAQQAQHSQQQQQPSNSNQVPPSQQTPQSQFTSQQQKQPTPQQQVPIRSADQVQPPQMHISSQSNKTKQQASNAPTPVSSQAPPSPVKPSSAQTALPATAQGPVRSSYPQSYLNNGVEGMTNGFPNAQANFYQGTAVLNYKKQIANLVTLKFLELCELIGSNSEQVKNILYWKYIVTEAFSESGIMRHSVKSGVSQRQFEFTVPIVPRVFFSVIQSGVVRMEVSPGALRAQVLANGTTYIESSRCCITHYYNDGSFVNLHGSMKVIFNQNLKMDLLDFQTNVVVPGVDWPSLEQLLSNEEKFSRIVKEYNEFGKDEEIEDPKNNTKMDRKNINLLQNFRSNFSVFHNMSSFGLQESVMRVMQVSDVMAHLKSLMMFSISSDTTGPLHALEQYVEKSQATQLAAQAAQAAQASQAAEATASTPGRPLTSATPYNNGPNFNKTEERTKSEKNSPVVNISSPSTSSPMSKSSKVTGLDLTQSALTKRRRKSALTDGISPKSTVDSPKSEKVNKKLKKNP
ncbi:hypothetical protein WICMUC_004181 [Wickerhamomyces mucosus]|uniref:Morphogenetic regulator of filamentous growth protein 1 n=1 Tax=Wickerhamomyces mucosus TaxID=1378264 RepID=A0A9P8PJP3_9ASCO|nr:hypothetical protein WICMUC_004181 [Wickerhamomyces mucosus]